MRHLWGVMRVPFLILTPACVSLGVGTVFWTGGRIHGGHVLLALTGAVFAHISVNSLNEYFDFRSGLDSRTQPTPFSGGSGTLARNPSLAGMALRIGAAAMVGTGVIGLYFVAVWGPGLLPLGILGLLIIGTYTPWLTRNPYLCLVAPGLGFGPLMIMGTEFALTGSYSLTALVASLVPFFLVSNLLLLNQFPDVQADESVGRRHLPIVLGRRRSGFLYGALLVFAYVSIAIGVATGTLPGASVLGLVTLVLAVPVLLGVLQSHDDIPRLARSMGLNVIVTVATPVLVAVGMFVA